MPQRIVIAFTDIVDSTAAKRAIGDSAYLSVADQHNALVRTIAGAHELKTIGDSFMLRFHDPVEAVLKLVEIQTRLEKNPIMLGSAPLAVRAGMHIGDATLWPSPKGDEDYLGTAVDQAARYESLAKGGQIIISADLHSHVKNRFSELPGITYHGWGPYYLKGVGWNHIYEVLWGNRSPVPPSGKPQYRPRRYLTPFVGRKEELEQIESLLADKDFPLITLKGPGGVGKSRLADEIEHRSAQLFHDGTYFVELESTANSVAAIEDQIRFACGVDSGPIEDFFAQKSVLLILNNCESVPLISGVVTKLLKHCGGLRILATSRTPLNVYGEQIWPVERFTPEDARALFLERACRAYRNFSVSAEDEKSFDVIFACTDRLPFCLELVAARVRPGRSLAGIASGIEASLGSPSTPMQTERHASVSACLDWSFNLLSQNEKFLFPRLSVFRGGFLAKDVPPICLVDDDAVLYSLLDASLLNLVDDRFHLLPIASGYATSKLGHDQYVVVWHKHSEYYLAMAEDAAAMARGQNRRQGIAVFRSEFDNMHAAMQCAVAWRNDTLALRFGYALAASIENVCKPEAQFEIGQWTVAAAERTGTPEDLVSAYTQMGATCLSLDSFNIGDFDHAQNAISWFQTALQFRTEQEFPAEWAALKHNLGVAHLRARSGNRDVSLQAAAACFESALRIRTELATPLDWAITQNYLGNVYRDLETGNREENLLRATSCYQAALRVQTEDAFPEAWATLQTNLGAALCALPSDTQSENFLSAIRHYQAALRVLTEENDPRRWASTLCRLGDALHDLPTGDHAENAKQAISHYENAIRGFRRAGFNNAADALRDAVTRLQTEL